MKLKIPKRERTIHQMKEDSVRILGEMSSTSDTRVSAFIDEILLEAYDAGLEDGHFGGYTRGKREMQQQLRTVHKHLRSAEKRLAEINREYAELKTKSEEQPYCYVPYSLVCNTCGGTPNSPRDSTAGKCENPIHNVQLSICF